MPSRIEDYALIGDCHTAALVARDGSIDWLCLPRFDSGACFAALLGKPEHGRWLVAPAGEVRRTQRRYRQDTLILETDFETDSGAVAVIDSLPVRDRHPHLVRIVKGKRGEVHMRLELMFRFDYGSIVPWVESIKGGIRAIAGPDAVRLLAPVELHHEDGHGIHAGVAVHGYGSRSGGLRVERGHGGSSIESLSWMPASASTSGGLDPPVAAAASHGCSPSGAARCCSQGLLYFLQAAFAGVHARRSGQHGAEPDPAQGGAQKAGPGALRAERGRALSRRIEKRARGAPASPVVGIIGV
jgi:hypothetical protein